MTSYSIFIKRSAAQELEDIPPKDRKRIAAKVTMLAGDPRPLGTQELSGEEHYRIRQGDYRVLYSFDDEGCTGTVVKIAHRRDVYR